MCELFAFGEPFDNVLHEVASLRKTEKDLAKWGHSAQKLN
jgi:hypothetical protein